AILIGIIAGVLSSLGSILSMAFLFGLDHKQYITLLPKSITTAIGMGVSEELGGYVTLTVAVIVITGILGNIFAVQACRLFHIEEPIAKGVAIGTSAHAIGTSKAMEIGEIEGAISGLSIAVAGLLTVVGASVFAEFL
ncbi:MAG: LrgB family protein, partial [Clostridiales bacterium]|nr:LrgB family protein [Clostridiales bacterium]